MAFKINIDRGRLQRLAVASGALAFVHYMNPEGVLAICGAFAYGMAQLWDMPSGPSIARPSDVIAARLLAFSVALVFFMVSASATGADLAAGVFASVVSLVLAGLYATGRIEV